MNALRGLDSSTGTQLYSLSPLSFSGAVAGTRNPCISGPGVVKSRSTDTLGLRSTRLLDPFVDEMAGTVPQLLGTPNPR